MVVNQHKTLPWKPPNHQPHEKRPKQSKLANVTTPRSPSFNPITARVPKICTHATCHLSIFRSDHRERGVNAPQNASFWGFYLFLPLSVQSSVEMSRTNPNKSYTLFLSLLSLSKRKARWDANLPLITLSISRALDLIALLSLSLLSLYHV